MEYIFEILCIDSDGQTKISSEQSISYALLFNENLWKSAEELKGKNNWMIKDAKQDLVLAIKPIDTSRVLTEPYDAAFILKITGINFNELEDFRLRLLRHLKDIKFKHIRILRDDISNSIANELYPEVNKIENLLRKYLTKFFIQRVGLDWWEATAPQSMIQKLKIRKSDRKDEFTNLAVPDVALTDFDDLGELVYKQSSGFNDPETVIQRILNSDTLDDLNKLKGDLQGNYTKYFKESFRDKDFEPKWKELFRIRNKVAHNGLFMLQELKSGMKLSEELKSIIDEAENRIDEIVFSIEDKYAIMNAVAAAESISDESKNIKLKEEDSNKLPGVKVIDKIDIDSKKYKDEYNPYQTITEDFLLNELEFQEGRINNRSFIPYVGLRFFVTTILAEQGFSIGATYAIINILKDKEKIEIFEPKLEDYPKVDLSRFDFSIAPKGIRIKR